MPIETSAAGLAGFLAAHAPLVARLHAAAEAARWGVTQEEFTAALYRSAAHRFAGQPPHSDALDEYLGAYWPVPEGRLNREARVASILDRLRAALETPGEPFMRLSDARETEVPGA